MSHRLEQTRPGASTAVAVAAALLGAARLVAGDTVADLLGKDRLYSFLPQSVFEQRGWSLPDEGLQVKALADAAPGGAFDPRDVAKLDEARLGYRARWHVVRFRHYGLEWDITGLHLQPRGADPGLPTLAIVHGGSANWYEFFLDPLNGPGLGQYLAQKLPVFLVTIPGHYRDGGWTEGAYDERGPAYLLGAPLLAQEAAVRNAAFTFALVAEGVRRLLEEATRGPLLVVGHSTGGELPFMLQPSSLQGRLRGRFLGWGTGGPAALRRERDQQMGKRAERVEALGRYPPVTRLRARSPQGYVSSRYIGPWNPLAAGSPLDVARAWFERERRRRPQFKPVLQDMEHQGMVEHRERLEREIRAALAGRTAPAAADVLEDLFAPDRSPLHGYRRMAWVVGRSDDGHWNADPEQALDTAMARRFRAENPGAAIRVLVIDAPLTHYGHIERPKQLAGVLLEVVKWLARP